MWSVVDQWVMEVVWTQLWWLTYFLRGYKRQKVKKKTVQLSKQHIYLHFSWRLLLSYLCKCVWVVMDQNHWFDGEITHPLSCCFPEELFSINVNYEMEAVIQFHQAYVTLWLPGVRIHLHCSYLTTQHLDNYLRWKHINLSIYALTRVTGCCIHGYLLT